MEMEKQFDFSLLFKNLFVVLCDQIILFTLECKLYKNALLPLKFNIELLIRTALQE